MHQVIIDTDPGIDDAQAIAYALAHPDIELRGLSTVFGNADIDLTTRNALQILAAFGRLDIPVARGAAKPLAQPRFDAPDFVHGTNGLGDIELPALSHSEISESAAEFICRQADELNGELCIITIGPLTNLAQALQLDAKLPSKIKQVIVMGGTVLEPGNVTPLAEANFINDPHAADAVLAQTWPLSVIGLDVTHRTNLFESDLLALKNSCGAIGEFLYSSSRYYFDFYRSNLGLENIAESRAPMHDASAVISLVNQCDFKFLSGAACVITEGVARGQLALDRKGDDYLLPHWEQRPAIDVAMQVNAEHTRQSFVDTLCTAFADSH